MQLYLLRDDEHSTLPSPLSGNGTTFRLHTVSLPLEEGGHIDPQILAQLELVEEPCIDPARGELVGTPLRWVNAHTPVCLAVPHQHLLWQKGRALRWSAVAHDWQKKCRTRGTT